MTAPKYFVQPATRWCCRRYCLLDRAGKTVIAIQASRPDGIEVPMPRAVTWSARTDRELLASRAAAAKPSGVSRLDSCRPANVVQPRVLRGCPVCGRIQPREEFLARGGQGRPSKICRTCRQGGTA